ncbi:MAG: hypothetical protein WDZ29_01945 [Balneolaceae bacterium]
MMMHSTLSRPQVRPNRRSVPRRKKRFPTAEKIYTGGGTPRNGTRKRTDKKAKSGLSVITPWKVILTSFLIGICGILYISHLFGTQSALQEVQQLQAEYTKVQRIHAEQRLAYERMVGPKEIYQNARELGFINAGPADRVITIQR